MAGNRGGLGRLEVERHGLAARKFGHNLARLEKAGTDVDGVLELDDGLAAALDRFPDAPLPDLRVLGAG